MNKGNIMTISQDLSGPADIAVDFGITTPCVEIDGLPLCRLLQIGKIIGVCRCDSKGEA